MINKAKKKSLKGWIGLMVLVGIVAVLFINRVFVRDFFRAISYTPSEEMKQIREELELTSNGEFIFNASKPTLSDRDSFNEDCALVKDESTAVLGCYVDENIYVYNIVQDELAGVRELTAAHELLHAVWERLDEVERSDLLKLLEPVLAEHQDLIGEEVEIYDEAKRNEELYVRAGTEIKNLPLELEKHYERVFKNQDKIVGYYDSYNKVFRELKEENERLSKEVTELKERYNASSEEYSSRVNKLKANIEEFNNCAAIAGCFGSQWEFNAKRAELLGERDSLNTLYEEITRLVDEINAKVEKHNQNAIYGQKLHQIMNSSVQVEENL